MIEFFRVQSYTMNDINVLCVAIRIKGLLTVFFTSDRASYDEWIAPLRTQIPPQNMTGIDHFAANLVTSHPRCGTRIITGWATMAIIDAFKDYHSQLGSDIQPFGWEMQPNTMDTFLYLHKTVFGKMQERGEPMLDINVPNDALFLFTGPQKYHAAIVYSTDQIAELATMFPKLSAKFLSTIPILHHASYVPETSVHEMVLLNSNSWIDEAAAVLICMWKRVSRFLTENILH
jgi:hypothetical protein